MPDADESRSRPRQQAIKQTLRLDIDRAGRFIKKDETRLRHQCAGKTDALLLAERQHPAPILLGGEATVLFGEIAEADALQDCLVIRGLEIAARRG
jgi:hypothetical protein